MKRCFEGKDLLTPSASTSAVGGILAILGKESRMFLWQIFLLCDPNYMCCTDALSCESFFFFF